jgi:SET domain-containing protein
VRTYLARSGIHGFGLFAAERIAPNTIIWDYDPPFDVAFERSVLEELPAVAREQIEHYIYFERTEGAYVLCGDNGRFMNHSLSPNTFEDENRGTIAKHWIEPGEEITCDYSDIDLPRPEEN